MSNRTSRGGLVCAATAALALGGISAQTLAAPAYEIYPMAPIGADTTGSGNAVSTNGAFAAGFSQHTTPSPAGSVPVLNDVSTRVSIAGPQLTTPARPFNEALGVNNSGVMVGRGVTTTFGSSPVPVMWTTSTAQQLPFPSASWNAGRAQAVNNNGVAVGSVQGGTGFPETVAIFTTGGSTAISTLTTAGGRLTSAFGINDAGRIVGSAIDPSTAAALAMYYLDDGAASAQIIPNLPGKNGGTAFAVSSNGFVTGSNTFNGGSGLPFIFSEANGTVEVPLPAGATTGGGRGVNSSGWVVGTGSGQFALPFLFDGTQTYLLSDLINDPTWNLSQNTSSGAFAISDNGVIVGRGIRNGVTSGFVMVPVPEPTSVASIAIAFVGTLGRRRRQ